MVPYISFEDVATALRESAARRQDQPAARKPRAARPWGRPAVSWRD